MYRQPVYWVLLISYLATEQNQRAWEVSESRIMVLLLRSEDLLTVVADPSLFSELTTPVIPLTLHMHVVEPDRALMSK